MKFTMEAPQELEVSSVDIRGKSVVVVPVTLKGQHVVKVGYLTATGDGGAQSHAVILFNGNTGEFTVQRRDGAPVQFDFDMPAVEFAKKREAAKKAGQRGQQLRRSSQQKGDSTDAVTTD